MNDFEYLFRQLDAAGMSKAPTLQGLVLSLLLALPLPLPLFPATAGVSTGSLLRTSTTS